METSASISTSTTNSTTNRINKWDPFLALVNLVEENNICYGQSSRYFPVVKGCDNKEEDDGYIVSQTQTARTIPLKDLTILANSAITTLLTRRRLLSTWKSVQGQPQNLRCGNLISPYCKQSFKTYDKIRKHIV